MGKTLNKKINEGFASIKNGTYGITDNKKSNQQISNAFQSIKDGTYSTKNNNSFIYTQEEAYNRNLLNQARIKADNIEATDQYKDAYKRYKNMSDKEFAKAVQNWRANGSNIDTIDNGVLKMMAEDPYHRASTGEKLLSDVGSAFASYGKGFIRPVDAAIEILTKGELQNYYADKVYNTNAIDQYKHRGIAQQAVDTIAGGLGGTGAMMVGGALGGKVGMFASMFPDNYTEAKKDGLSDSKAFLLATLKSGAGTAIEEMGGLKFAEGDYTLRGLSTIIEEASEEAIEAVVDRIADDVINGTLFESPETWSDTLVDALQSAALSVPTTLILGGAHTIGQDVKVRKSINKTAKETGIKKSEVKKQINAQIANNQYTQNKVQSEDIKNKAKETASNIDSEYGTINTEQENAKQQEILDEVKKKEDKVKKQQETRKKNKEAKEAAQRAKDELNAKLEKQDTDPKAVLDLKDKIQNLQAKIDANEDADIKEALQDKQEKLINELDQMLDDNLVGQDAIQKLKSLGVDTTVIEQQMADRITVNKQEEVKPEVVDTTEEVKTDKIKEEKEDTKEYNYVLGEIKKRNNMYTSEIFDENEKYLGTASAKTNVELGKILATVQETGVIPDSQFTEEDRVKYDAIEEQKRIEQEKLEEKKKHYQEGARKRKEAQEAKREETRALNNKGVKTTNVDTTELMNKKAETFDRDLSKIDPARRQEYKQGTIDLYNKYLADGGKEIEKFEQLKNELENDKAIDKAVAQAKAQEIIEAKEARSNEETTAKKLAKKKEANANKPRLRDLEYNAKNEYDLFAMSGKEVHKNKALGWYKQYKDNGGKHAIDNLEQLIHPLSEKQEQATEQAVKQIEKETNVKVDTKQLSAKDLFMQQLKQQMDIVNMTPTERARLERQKEQSLIDAVTKGVDTKEDKKTLNKMKRDKAIKAEIEETIKADTELDNQSIENTSPENQYKLMRKLDLNQKVDYNTHDNIMPTYITNKYSDHKDIVNDVLNNINVLGLNNKNGQYNDIIDRVIHDRILFGIDIKFTNSVGLAANSEESNVAASKLAKKNIGGVYIRRGETGNETRRILLNTQLGKVDMMHELLAHELSHHLQNFGSKTELDEAMFNWRRAKVMKP